jgi:hypothetical protein
MRTMKVSRPRAVSVPLVRGEVDEVSGPNLDDGLALPPGAPCAPCAGDDVEELALGVGVPVRARPRLEEHAEEARAGREGWRSPPSRPRQ